MTSATEEIKMVMPRELGDQCLGRGGSKCKDLLFGLLQEERGGQCGWNSVRP